ncbi:MAG TPA: ABC transporter permease [Actinomycetes bacterium]|nr:ABC transporter permease [Actinomycetes bacterium]
MVRTQAAVELRALRRNGEQLLLVLIIPVGLLVLGSTVPLFDVGRGERVDFLLPGVIGLAVMSTSFVGLAIATGFERRYGVLKRLGASPLPRSGLLAGKALAILVIEVLQILVLVLVALALGWTATTSVRGWAYAALLVVAATVAFAALGLLMAGLLRAEATLAAANLVYLLFLVGGGVVVPLDRLPEVVRPVLEALPLAALTNGLRMALEQGTLPLAELAILATWAALLGAITSRTFRFS